MSILLVGISHHSAPIAVLEQLVAIDLHQPALLHSMLDSELATEAMILSTCNRVEIYIVTEHDQACYDLLLASLSQYLDITSSQLDPYLYTYKNLETVKHLFSVACGLDSIVIGEQQILGQVRRAYTLAQQHNSIGPHLHDIVQRALQIGKSVYSQTEIASANLSIVSAILDLGEQYNYLPHRHNTCGIVIGAGLMGILAAQELIKRGICQLFLANRSIESAQQLATKLHQNGVEITVVSLEQLPALLAMADIVVCAARVTQPLLNEHNVPVTDYQYNTNRHASPLVICDLGIPRNVDTSLTRYPGITILNMDHLLENSVACISHKDIDTAWSLIEHGIERFIEEQKIAVVKPTLTALRQHAADMVEIELHRLDQRLPQLTPEYRQEITHTINRVVDKLLHAPTVKVKQLATSSEAESYIEIIHELFALPSVTSHTVNLQSCIALSGDESRVMR